MDYIIIDSPILFSTIYHTYYTEGYPTEFYGQEFHDLVISLHKKYDNINILLERNDSVHNEDERFQSLDESLTIDKLCKQVLDNNDIPYHSLKVDKNTVNNIINLL